MLSTGLHLTLESTNQLRRGHREALQSYCRMAGLWFGKR
jgi:hypothetical protein